MQLIRKGENFLVSTSYIFDMTEYNLIKKKRNLQK